MCVVTVAGSTARVGSVAWEVLGRRGRNCPDWGAHDLSCLKLGLQWEIRVGGFRASTQNRSQVVFNLLSAPAGSPFLVFDLGDKTLEKADVYPCTRRGSDPCGAIRF